MPGYSGGSSYGRVRNYSRSKTMQTGGTVYQKGGANFEVKKHVKTRIIEIEPSKTAIIPLLHYNAEEPLGVAIDASSKVTAQGTKIYQTTAVQDGSSVRNLHLEIQIQPKTLSSSAILDFYTGRIITSFHDLKGDQIYGLEASTTTEGKATFTDEAITGTPTTVEVSATNGVENPVPVNPMVKSLFDQGDVIKHWWKNMRKNVIYGGQPVLYNAWEKVPAKCTRSNPGMFYGLIIMNDSAATSDDTDVLRVEIKEHFTEIPLVQ